MTQRGRKSAAQMSVVKLEVKERPKPPETLTGREAKEWRKIVDAMPVDWFTEETLPLLANLCRHIVSGEMLSERINATDMSDTMEMNRLMTMRSRETTLMLHCATKLRLTNQSRMRTETAGRKVKNNIAKKPWEFTG